MIGVIADPADYDVVREFFELFKTPWEYYRSGQRYDVLLCAGPGQFDGTAKLVLFYAGKRTHFDNEQKVQTCSQRGQPCILSYQGNEIPIYGASLTFPGKHSCILMDENVRECAAHLERHGERVLVRIGYDLFDEVRTLLTVGQPPVHAKIPTLELHIAFLRELITGSGVPLVEIPPVPLGYWFVACLTHDVDHPSIRQHKWDHTMFGFLYRATFGSLRRLIGGRMSVRDLVTNWGAALKLPFVHLGLAKDFWGEFADRYLELEKGFRSTYFMIPSKNYPGKDSSGTAPRLRAAGYGAQDIAGTIRKLMAAGCEVGLHGIDAWLDSSKGSEELEEIRRLTGVSEIGVRMHWLYHNKQTALALEKAGAAYDSTMGYNETPGYRAGTTQAYKPLQATRLLELPLHVMDTALFYPGHLGLSRKQAKMLLSRMVDNALRFGGSLTINWHDRSVMSERLWDACYRDLLQDLKDRGAWLTTAGQAISWFRKRRSAAFETERAESGAARAKVTQDHGNHLPGLRLRIHKARGSSRNSPLGSEDYVDFPVRESVDIPLPSAART